MVLVERGQRLYITNLLRVLGMVLVERTKAL